VAFGEQSETMWVGVEGATNHDVEIIAACEWGVTEQSCDSAAKFRYRRDYRSKIMIVEVLAKRRSPRS